MRVKCGCKAALQRKKEKEGRKEEEKRKEK